MNKNNTLTYRVEQLENDGEQRRRWIDEIRTDQLPLIRTELVALKTRITVLTVLNVGTVVVAMIITKVFGG